MRFDLELRRLHSFGKKKAGAQKRYRPIARREVLMDPIGSVNSIAVAVMRHLLTTIEWERDLTQPRSQQERFNKHSCYFARGLLLVTV